MYRFRQFIMTQYPVFWQAKQPQRLPTITSPFAFSSSMIISPTSGTGSIKCFSFSIFIIIFTTYTSKYLYSIHLHRYFLFILKEVLPTYQFLSFHPQAMQTHKGANNHQYRKPFPFCDALIVQVTLALKPLTVRGETVSNTVKRKLLRISELDKKSDTYTILRLL